MKCILIKDFFITKDALFKIKQLFYNQMDIFDHVMVMRISSLVGRAASRSFGKQD